MIDRPPPPWHAWPVEQWEHWRGLHEAHLAKDPKHKPTREVIRLCDFYIARARG